MTPNPEKRKTVLQRSKGGALLLISVLMLSSGLLRIGLETGPALAKSVADLAVDETETPQQAPAKLDKARFHAMLVAFQEREERISALEVELADRQRAIEIAEKAVETQLQAILEAEQSLRATLAIADGAMEGDVARLTEVYENMKPKDAAALFSEMAPQFAAGFLSRMRADTAAAVLAGMAPDTAYSISVIMAGRHSGVPRE